MSVDKNADDHDVLDVEMEDDSYYDEFDDQDSASDIDDEDWDDVDEYESAPAPEKKKSSLGNIIIIGVAVIAGLGFMVYKFGGSSQTQQDAPKISLAQTQVTQDTAQASPEQANVAFPQEAMTAMPDVNSAMPPMEEEASASGPLTPMPVGGAVDIPQPTPIEPVGSVAQSADLEQPVPVMEGMPPLMSSGDVAVADGNIVEPEVVGQPSQGEQPPLLQPVSDFPSADMIKKVNSDSSQDEVAAPAPIADAPVEMASPQVNQVAPSSQQLDEAMAKIKNLQATVDKNSESAKEYQDQIQTLEDQVSYLKSQLAQAQESEAPVAPAASVKEPQKVSKTVAPVEAKPAVAVSVSKWKLKGAQSGSALLASDSVEGDLRRVAVGDQVPGLGRILSIEKGQSGWVVLGTVGKVTQ